VEIRGAAIWRLFFVCVSAPAALRLPWDIFGRQDGWLDLGFGGSWRVLCGSFVQILRFRMLFLWVSWLESVGKWFGLVFLGYFGVGGLGRLLESGSVVLTFFWCKVLILFGL